MIFSQSKPVFMKLIQRAKAPTPKFFKKIRNAGLAVAAIGTTLLSAPVALPPVLLKLAGYLVVAGGVASAVSQVATGNDSNAKQ